MPLVEPEWAPPEIMTPDTLLPERLEPLTFMLALGFGLLAVYTSVVLARRSRQMDWEERKQLLPVGGVVVGVGIWSAFLLFTLSRHFPILSELDPALSALALVASGGAAVAITLSTGFRTRSPWAALLSVLVAAPLILGSAAETVRIRAELMEAVAEFDEVYASQFPGGAREATLFQLRQALERSGTFGNTGTIQVTQLVGDSPIVALTAHALDEERRKARSAGMDDFVSKPFKAHELFQALERVRRHPSPSD
ncbi:MAG: response regulator [Gemmatimonadota bacterium]